MPTNPFEPPESDARRHPREPAAPRSPFAAVMLGLLVDVGGSALVGIATTAVYASRLREQGVPAAELGEAIRHMPHDSALYMGAMLLGIALSVLGGYVCARVARRGEYRAGLIMAAASALLGMALSGGAPDTDMGALLLVTGIACNLLGVKFGADHNRRDEAPAP